MSRLKIEELFFKIRDLKSRSEELAKLRGENFNIFKLLNLERSETTLHSTLLTELLNPNGSHGFGDIFLRDFIHRLNLEYKLNLDEDFRLTGEGVRKEKYISSVNLQRVEGGFLDIFIETDKFVIGIENKVFSGEGNLQLERYSKFLKQFDQSHLKTALLYLTLDGKNSESETLEANKNYYCLSYQEFILDWLESCHSKVSDSPIIRETVKQYMITIQFITNQLTSHKMEKDLESLLEDHFAAAKFVVANFGKVQDRLIIKLYGMVKKHLEIKLPSSWDMDFNLDVLTQNWNQISFRQNWVDGLSISFEGTPKFINGFGHGILLSNENYNPNDIKSQLADQIKFSNRTNNWMVYNSCSYSQLSGHITDSNKLEILAEEISNYMLHVIEKEKANCDIINLHLLTLGAVAEK